MRKIYYLLLAGVTILGNLGLNFGSAMALSSCDDVRFIFARGSGERLGDVSATEWKSQLEQQIASHSTLKYSFYELGSAEQGGFKYPAVTVGGIDGVGNLIGAAISGGEAFQFGESVQAGMAELKSYIASVSASCPGTKFVLGGYSQGAMVISQSLPDLDPAKIIYVATFGDPKLYLPEGEGAIPAACLGKNFSEYRRDVVDCRAFEGILGSQRPYQPEGFSKKVGLWCNNSDIMCSSKWNLDDHTRYVADGKYAQAAKYIAKLIQQEFPRLIVIDWQKNASVDNDVVFLVDSTGSMTKLIENYKSEARNLAQEVIDGGGRIALFEFRDLADPFLPVMHCDLSCSYEDFTRSLDSITTDGGGDDRESALSAMLYAMNEVEWQIGANKTMVVVTDNGVLDPDRDGTTLRDVAKLSLKIDPVNAYFITNSAFKNTYSSIARTLGGKVFSSSEDLSLSTRAILDRPVAKLANMEYDVPLNSSLVFDASESYALMEDSGQNKLTFDWDLNGDGVFEFQNAGSVIEQVYRAEFDDYIQVRVTDTTGKISTMSAHVKVQAEDEQALATINKISAEPIVASATRVEFSTDAERVLIILDDAILGYKEIDGSEINQKLSISGLEQNGLLTLIPYDKNGQSGVRKTVALRDEASDAVDDTGQTTDKSPSSSGSNLNNTNIDTLSASSQSTTYTDKKRDIPLAPNAGVPPKSKP